MFANSSINEHFTRITAKNLANVEEMWEMDYNEGDHRIHFTSIFGPI